MSKHTGYALCQEMVKVIQTELRALKKIQRNREPNESHAGQVKALALACSSLQGEIRKTGDDADKAVSKLPPERRLELILKMIRDDLSPDHRSAIRVYLDELQVALI